MIKYIKSVFKSKISMESRPEEEMGYNSDDIDSNYEFIGDVPYHKTDAGLVNIKTLIEKLKEMESEGINYVGCEYHCDHVELDLYGFVLEEPTESEINEFIHGKKRNGINECERQINHYNDLISVLKKKIESIK
jgi:hypothetical protein